jgi:hypothetical protein
MRKLTFKEYLDSKNKLRKAIQNTPVASTYYIVKKYCKLRVGDKMNERREIPLKPRQTIIVEWQYDDINDPQPNSVVFSDSGQEEHPVYWSGRKLQEWLSKNTFEEF